ncbi:disulfide bond formation protein B [Candidatus Liberibacter solanacearum]|uniref:Disulfide bond formation protein B n=1 Tax=Candidatus Liberibacter solanacearum TaxID=556287 RepID=A0A424FMW6_9HYPH|nr:disulfide bond formation protein B [Candidatus Liberibacter solanacearum]RPD37458.1 disulfide bond formation protein B [Candidatus Liberibacter solanacearum]
MIKSLLSKLENIHIIRIITTIIAGIIISFLTIQHVGGYAPCDFCLREQRPYYYCFLMAIAANFSIQNNRLYRATFFLLMTISLIMLYDTVISIIHVGIEWNIWRENTICTNDSKIESIENTIDLLINMEREYILRCNQTKLYILGLSLAFWNVILSFMLSVISYIAAGKTSSFSDNNLKK